MPRPMFLAIFLWVFVFMLLMMGCSHSLIVKDCNKVEGDSGFSVCKNLKTWE